MSQEAIESNAIVTRLDGVKALPSSLHETLMMTWHQGYTDFRPNFCTRGQKTLSSIDVDWCVLCLMSYVCLRVYSSPMVCLMSYLDVKSAGLRTTAALRTMMRHKWSFSSGIS